jgi:NAD(P)-dependent dehydrogenase (short-subunit alcohol dehydrogenase family)
MPSASSQPSRTPGHVVVVGGTSGIGLATAQLAERHGARVTVAGRSRANHERAQATLSTDATVLALDATQIQATRAAFERIGPLDHLVISLAGRAALGLFEAIDLDGVRATLEVKLFAYLTVLKSALSRLAAQGSITFVTGMSARKPAPGIASLAMANGAAEALIGVLALELAPRRVNAVSPGVIRTPAWDRLPPDARKRMFDETAVTTPLRRVGEANDVAAAVLSLIENPFVTGVVLPCDGGMGVS